MAIPYRGDMRADGERLVREMEKHEAPNAAADAAVFAGCFADFKLVRTRKTVQVIIELPIEKGADFLNAFGMPDPSKEQWVAIAALKERPTLSTITAVSEHVIRNPQAADKTVYSPQREKTEGEKAVVRAVMLCKDPTFQEWSIVPYRYGGAVNARPGEESARDYICVVCGISSRSELATNPEARKRFEQIETSYRYRDPLGR